MTLKATLLYSKIVEKLELADSEDIRRINQLQDSLLVQGRWTPIGQLYIDNELLTSKKHEEVLRHHAYTNWTSSDRVVSHRLVEEGLLDAGAADAILEEARSTVKPGRFDPTVSAFDGRPWPHESAEAKVREILEKGLEPLSTMTGYTEELIGKTPDQTQGRLAFQLHYVSREQLLDSLIERTREEIGKPLIDYLVATGRLNEPEEESVRSTIDRFLP